MGQTIFDFSRQGFTFLNSGGITIPLDFLQKAFSLEIDIIIRSVDWNLYKNFEVLPEESFFGYAEIVFGSGLTEKIPIRQPRQRIYTETQYSAMSEFTELRAYYTSLYLYQRELLLQIGKGNSEEVPHYPRVLSDWIILPIRQVFFKAKKDCQFDFMINRISPTPFTDPANVLVTGKTNYQPPSKERGLPPNGIQPKQNSPSDPYKGNPDFEGLATPDNGWYAPSSSFGNQDADNGYPDDWGYFAEIAFEYAFESGQCRRFREVNYFLVRSDSVLSVIRGANMGGQCSGTFYQFTASSSTDGELLSLAVFSMSATIVRSLNKPANTATQL
jgi:hypothetical protein